MPRVTFVPSPATTTPRRICRRCARSRRPREPAPALPSGGKAKRLIADHPLHRVAELLDVLRLDEQARPAVDHRLGDPAHARRHDRQARSSSPPAPPGAAPRCTRAAPGNRTPASRAAHPPARHCPARRQPPLRPRRSARSAILSRQGPSPTQTSWKPRYFLKQGLGRGRQFVHSLGLDQARRRRSRRCFLSGQPSRSRTRPLSSAGVNCLASRPKYTHSGSRRHLPVSASLAQMDWLTPTGRSTRSSVVAEPPPQDRHPVRVHHHVAAHRQADDRQAELRADDRRRLRIREHRDAHDQIERLPLCQSRAAGSRLRAIDLPSNRRNPNPGGRK